MHLKKSALLVLLGVTLLGGCSQTTTQAPKSVVKQQVTTVNKRTKADANAWSAAKAESRANAASAKKLSEQSSTLTKADDEASSQANELSESRESASSASAKAASSAAEAASSTAASQSEANSKAAASSAKATSTAAADTQTSSANHANNFSGDTDTAQTGLIIGNSRSKIYHVETQHNYHMSGKNVVQFNTEAEAQAAGYRKSMR